MSLWGYYEYCYDHLCTKSYVDLCYYLFLFGFYLGDELLGLMVTQCVTFGGTARLFPTVACACLLNLKEKKILSSNGL